MNPVKVEIDVNKLKRTLSETSEQVAAALAEQVLSDSTQFVPYSAGSVQSAGALRESGRIDKGTETGVRYLIWDTVYALYQWFGVRADGSHVVQHYTTAGTGKEWVYMAEKAFGKDWTALSQRIVKGRF